MGRELLVANHCVAKEFVLVTGLLHFVVHELVSEVLIDDSVHILSVLSSVVSQCFCSINVVAVRVTVIVVMKVR